MPPTLAGEQVLWVLMPVLVARGSCHACTGWPRMLADGTDPPAFLSATADPSISRLCRRHWRWHQGRRLQVQ